MDSEPIMVEGRAFCLNLEPKGYSDDKDIYISLALYRKSIHKQMKQDLP